MKKIFLLFLILLLHPFFVFAAGTVEINTASLAQLDDLTGIGPKYAQAIIDARPYSSVDDLLRVKGIGPKTLQKIKDQGLAYVDGQTQLIVQPVATPDNAATPAPATATLQEPAPASPQPSAVIYPSGIFINEIMPNPKGADETDEWIELYNSNNFEIDLSDWQLQDVLGTITTYTIPQNAKISADGFLVFKRPDTKIMLNNDQDGLNLLTPDEKIVGSVGFVNAPLGQSYNKTLSGDWQWSTTLTPGTKNIITAVRSASTVKTLSNPKNSVNNDNITAGLAGAGQNLNQDGAKTNPWFLFLIALAGTVILAMCVLFIKLKIFKTHVRT